MKVNVDKVLKNIDGSNIKDVVDGKAVDAKLKTILVNAVLAPVDKESGVDKVKKYELAKMIHKGKTIDLTSEDITMLKDAVALGYAPLIVGQVFEMLEK